MAGVAVLQPQDVLKQQRVSYRPQPMRSRRNSSSNPIPNPNPNPKNNNRRKRSPQKNGSASTPHLVMGEVKILKRGEALTNNTDKVVVKEKKKVVSDLVLSTTDRLGPEPDMVPKQMNFYAGSAFVSSPPPSSLPVPAFFKKTSDATTDLRRLLRLDLE
ncbi:uncharacterized protein LOC132045911 [Lycium ferocissimum]|uniref:uncharacterized protein LOC132045911 n=1 Tax=Lycium ferocissimum TaxID=112874 RepID=UPI0028162D63|nr:uncharacterized protein LOC132045911 [Lycium ferocissimum]